MDSPKRWREQRYQAEDSAQDNMREEKKARPKESERWKVLSNHGSQIGKRELDRKRLFQNPMPW